MAKLFIFLFALVAGINFSATIAQRMERVAGQAGHGFIRGKIEEGGPLDYLATAVTEGANNLLCTLIGPDFLRVVLTKNRCPSGVVLPTLFKSYKSYCHFYHRQPPIIKQCLTDAAARVDLDLNGIIKLDLLLGICCKNCNPSHFQSVRMTGGHIIHDLVRVGLSSAGLVGGLTSGLFDTTNQLVCTLLGPNFLRILLDECTNDLGGVVHPAAFKSYQDFCAFYNSLPANRKRYIRDGAIRIKGPSIYRLDFVIGHCCAQCAQPGNLPQSPPSCKSTNGTDLGVSRKGMLYSG